MLKEPIMHDHSFQDVIDEQRQFFLSGATRPIAFRIEQLEKLKSILQMHEADIAAALQKDLHKPLTEAVLDEILLVLEEIKLIIKNLKKWSRPKKVSTPFPALWPGRSSIHYEPYGTVLIIGPWNYPFLLTISPLIGAISAGNCAVVKPSEIATHTQNLIVDLISNHFPSKYIAAIRATPDEMPTLLQAKWDYIFFTGGTHIGKIVMEAAAKQLIPVTLELGGKNPCLIDTDANLDFAARRVAWAKTTNAGQVCLAPDYLYVHHTQKDAFVQKLIRQFQQFYGDDPSTSTSFGRIINHKHFARLTKLMQKGRVLYGGKTIEKECYIAPTLLDQVTWDDPIMQEEIFGPLLPIFTYENIEDVINIIQTKPKSLALYLFTKNKAVEEKCMTNLSFGGGCINDCIMQVANLHLPFGGVGLSGIGQYHGWHSFETFSHKKAIYKKTMPIDFKLEYPPFTDTKRWWLRRILKM